MSTPYCSLSVALSYFVVLELITHQLKMGIYLFLLNPTTYDIYHSELSQKSLTFLLCVCVYWPGKKLRIYILFPYGRECSLLLSLSFVFCNPPPPAHSSSFKSRPFHQFEIKYTVFSLFVLSRSFPLYAPL